MPAPRGINTVTPSEERKKARAALERAVYLEEQLAKDRGTPPAEDLLERVRQQEIREIASAALEEVGALKTRLMRYREQLIGLDAEPNRVNAIEQALAELETVQRNLMHKTYSSPPQQGLF